MSPLPLLLLHISKNIDIGVGDPTPNFSACYLADRAVACSRTTPIGAIACVPHEESLIAAFSAWLLHPALALAPAPGIARACEWAPPGELAIAPRCCCSIAATLSC
jgi:hypothetical protein